MSTEKHEERKLKVNALAVQAKTDTEVIPQLWQMVKQLIGRVCLRYCLSDAGTRLYEFDDLYQSAYFAFLKAIDAYDDTRGAFSTVLVYYVRRSCCKELGKYGSKTDPIFKSASIDQPLSTDGEDLTLMNTLSDPDSEESFAKIELNMIVEIVLNEVDRFNNSNKRQIIREHTYQGIPLQGVADSMGISKQRAFELEQHTIRYLRRQPKIRALYDEYQTEEQASIRESAVSPYRRKSIAAFHSDFTSVVEDIVMRLESGQ